MLGGWKDDGECSLPALDGGLAYVHSGQSRLLPALDLQASFDGSSMHFVTLGGEELCHVEATATGRLADLQVQLRHEIGPMHSRVDVILPGGERLSMILAEEPSPLLGMLNLESRVDQNRGPQLHGHWR